MAGVFDTPVAADGMRDSFHAHRQTADKSAAPQPRGPIRTPTQRLAIHRIDRLSDARGRRRSRLHGL